jgi:hypothetical protein
MAVLSGIFDYGLGWYRVKMIAFRQHLLDYCRLLEIHIDAWYSKEQPSPSPAVPVRTLNEN